MSPEAVAFQDREGRTALHYAVHNHYPIYLKDLVQHMDKSTIHLCDNNGKRAIDYLTDEEWVRRPGGRPESSEAILQALTELIPAPKGAQ